MENFSDLITEHGLTIEDVINQAMKMALDVNSHTKVRMLLEEMYVCDYRSEDNEPLSNYEKHAVTSAINTVYKARFLGLRTGKISFANHTYIFKINEFDSYEFIERRPIDGE